MSPEPSQKWARPILKGRIFWGVTLILGVFGLIVVVTISRRSGQELQEATRDVTRTRETLEKLGDISTKLSEVESAARSFAISGKQSHLNPFYTAAKEVPAQMNELKILLRSDLKELQSFKDVEPIVLRHLKAMKEMVDLGNKNLFRGSSQRTLTDEGNRLMEQIRNAFALMEKRQRRRLEDQEKEVTTKAERVTLVNLEGSVLAGLLVLVCGASTLRTMRGRDKAQEKLDRLLGSMPDALVIVTAEGKIVGSNRHTEKLFGYNDHELQGENMALLVPERFRQTQRQHYTACFAQRNGNLAAATTELRGLHKDGREFPIEVSTKQLAAEKGLVVITAIRDITERKRAEEQISKLNKELELRALELETANKELEAFSYSVSHDLRAPFRHIVGYSELLVQSAGDKLSEKERRFVATIVESAKSAGTLVDDLLSFSQMGRSTLGRVQVNMNDLATDTRQRLEMESRGRHIDWRIATLPVVDADPAMLRLVWQNLFSNAIKFTRDSGEPTIEVTYENTGDAHVFHVHDNGCGFDMRYVDKLFGVFQRLHHVDEYEGTGIGLANVRRIIERHGGNTWAHGQLGQGATISFSLPLSNESNK